LKIIEEIAYKQPELSSLDVWRVYRGPQPKHRRAMGAAFVRASRRGLISPTGKRILSGRASDHKQEIRMWRSNVFEGVTTHGKGSEPRLS
jgi:hypothetical protein